MSQAPRTPDSASDDTASSVDSEGPGEPEEPGGEGTDHQCMICFCEMSHEARGTHRLACGHVFHTECILRWAQSDADAHHQCPVCRFSEWADGTPDGLTVSPMAHAVWQERSFRTASRAMERVIDSFTEGERAVYQLLRADVDRTANVEEKACRDLAEFRREHRVELQRHRTLSGRRWRARMRAHDARRTLLSAFPVTRVVLPAAPRSSRRSQPRVVRRSARLAELATGGSTDGSTDDLG